MPPGSKTQYTYNITHVKLSQLYSDLAQLYLFYLDMKELYVYGLPFLCTPIQLKGMVEKMISFRD